LKLNTPGKSKFYASLLHWSITCCFWGCTIETARLSTEHELFGPYG